MKKIIKFLASMMILGVSLTGCKKNKASPDVFQLDFQKGDNGYYITVERYERKISTINGSIGVRFDKNEFRADEPIYSNYQSVEKVEDGLLAKGEISSRYGTVIAFTDYISALADRILVNREISVKTVGEDYGFMVEQKWTDLEDAQIHQKEWFIPGMFYVNGDHTFDKSSTRVFFDGESLTIRLWIWDRCWSI